MLAAAVAMAPAGIFPPRQPGAKGGIEEDYIAGGPFPPSIQPGRWWRYRLRCRRQVLVPGPFQASLFPVKGNSFDRPVIQQVILVGPVVVISSRPSLPWTT
jgi:hypothetical protein